MSFIQNGGTLVLFIQKMVALQKVEIFAWQAIQNRVATTSELMRRNIIDSFELGNLPVFALRSKKLQTICYYIAHFPRRLIWSKILLWWNLYIMGMTFWINSKYNLGEYAIEDFKRCLDGTVEGFIFRSFCSLFLFQPLV